MVKPGRSGPFPEGTGCKSRFLIMYAGTELKCALKIAPLIQKKIIKNLL